MHFIPRTYHTSTGSYHISVDGRVGATWDIVARLPRLLRFCATTRSLSNLCCCTTTKKLKPDPCRCVRSQTARNGLVTDLDCNVAARKLSTVTRHVNIFLKQSHSHDNQQFTLFNTLGLPHPVVRLHTSDTLQIVVLVKLA